MKILFTLLLLAAPVAVSAQTINIAPGMSADIHGFTLERDTATGVGTLILGLRPNYDPEPYGPVPPADVAQVHEAICNHYAALNADVMAQNDASRFAVRWDWTPVEQPDNGITVSRFHRNDFTVSGDGCRLIWTVSPEFPTLLSGATPRLIGARSVEDRRLDGLGLEMTYDWGSPLDDADEAALDRAALELCLTVVEDEMLRRQDNYRNLDYDFLSVAFQERGADGVINRRVFTKALDGGACINDLPDAEVAAIRQAAAR